MRVALALLLHILLRRTRFGRYVVAIGCNERAALYSGLAVDRIKPFVVGPQGPVSDSPTPILSPVSVSRGRAIVNSKGGR